MERPPGLVRTRVYPVLPDAQRATPLSLQREESGSAMNISLTPLNLGGSEILDINEEGILKKLREALVREE